MDFHTLPDKPRRRRKITIDKKMPRQPQLFRIEASSQQDLFKKSLKAMAHRLKRGVCSGSNHSDCTMKVQLQAADMPTLLVDFLSKVLALTHAHRTIFCTLYFEKLTEAQLVAQLYGNWFDTFDTEIKTISRSGCSVEREGDDSFTASIRFNY